jgi:transcriptional regulator with XRE-family HTH domain
VRDPARHVQLLLGAMPAKRAVLAVQTDSHGRQLVVADRAVVLFGPFQATDLGARNLAIISLTEIGFGVGETAAAFGLRPGTVSELRTAFHRDGAAGVVTVSGRRAKLDEDTMTEARALKAQGWTQAQLAAKYHVTQPAISQALHRTPTRATDDQPLDDQPLDDQPLDDQPLDDQPLDDQPLDDQPFEDQPFEDQPLEEAPLGGGYGQGLVSDPQPAAGQDEDRDEQERSWGNGAAFGLAAAGGSRIEQGVFACRYAGAMLAYAYTDRAGVGPVLTGLDGAAWRRFDQAQITAFALAALLLGVGSVEQVKTLVPPEAGPLIGTRTSPGLAMLRSRLAAIADASDIPAMQTTLAAAMLGMPGQGGGVYYVDDHFVPYAGARPVAMGHNSKRGRCEPGRADTLISDARGRAVCFASADPTHLSKTMKPALAQLRQIIPTGKILLGFDRGGAYAEAFTACRQADIDFVTYRRGALAPVTATATAHHITRDRKKITVILADDQIRFSDDYTGPCRQLSLYEPDPDCTCPHPDGQPATCPHLRLVLQVLTSDLTASAPDLLFALKGRWIIENAFKYLDFYGIDWLTDYHADIAVNTKLIDNPARKAANTAIRAAKTAHADAERALGALLSGPATPEAKNTAIPPAQQAVTDTQAKIKELVAARDQLPVKLPANQVNPAAQRAVQRAHRRGLLMLLRLLAYNTDTWLADHLNVYLHKPNEYRAITRSLMHHHGTITYTPDTITVTLEHHHRPCVQQALTRLLEELNTHPAHLPGDPRPLTYQIAPT